MQRDYNGNVRGLVSDLYDAGLRVPVAALPHSYIIEMYKNANYTAKTGNPPQLFSGEIKLLRHLYDMAERGFDPVYKDETLSNTIIFESEGRTHFECCIKPFTDSLMNKGKNHKKTVQQQTVRR